MDALLIEVELLLEWYLPRLGIVVTDDARADFFGHWRDALEPLLAAPLTWTLRDYHSPNLLWLPDREEIARLGVLDFQDAVMGPPAYDLASLLQDARVDVPEDVEVAAARPLCAATARPPIAEFDPGTFIRSYVTMAAQRAIEDPRHLRAPRRARRQAAIFASHPADIGLPATLAGAPRARAAERVVQPPCSGAKVLTIRKHL